MLNKLFVLVAQIVLFTTMSSADVMAAETESNPVNSHGSKKTPLIINSQVKGSQEQANVIYIMPWQGISKAITIDGHTNSIVLPNFAPVNPKTFKQQTRQFYKVNASKQVAVSQQ